MSSSEGGGNRIIRDNDLSVKTIFEGFDFPVSIEFLGPDDILVLEKMMTLYREL